MEDALYTKRQPAQFRGPTTSDQYNDRVEDLYKDFVYLYNKANLTQEELRAYYRRVINDHISLIHVLEELETRVAALEAGRKVFTFYSADLIDDNRFDTDSEFYIDPSSRCTHEPKYGLLTLPQTGNVSKIKYQNAAGVYTIPSTLDIVTSGNASTADDGTALIDESDPKYAVLPNTGKIWERNVVAKTLNGSGAEVSIYISVPSDISVVAESNYIALDPYPSMGCDLTYIGYSTSQSITLTDSDGYTALNSGQIYQSNTDAVGWLPPGGWTGDDIYNAGPKKFFFSKKPITALKFTLSQTTFTYETDRYIYTYGLSGADLGLSSYQASGRKMVRFDAPSGQTISSIDNITPEIWNISEAELPSVFSYRAIWETSYNSGVYTTTPVPFSSRVWIEVTLNSSVAGTTPALSSLRVEYS